LEIRKDAVDEEIPIYQYLLQTVIEKFEAFPEFKLRESKSRIILTLHG
jgi:hypothetical protein